MSQPVTIDDVARRAGVSPRTVSRVLNNLPNVSRKARSAIDAAIAELDYHPNLAARALASARSFFIGVMCPAVSGSYFFEINAALVAACRLRGYHPVIEQLSTKNGDVGDQVARSMREVRFAGLIVLSIPSDEFGIRDLAEAAGIPLINITHFVSTKDGASISANDAEGEAMLADHLWGLGHRRFGVPFMEGLPNFRRGAAFVERLSVLGCNSLDIMRYPINWRAPALEIGRTLATDMMQQGNMPTALFALSDDVAASAMGTFHEAGVKIPEDISIAGFDDMQLARAVWPQLTTVRQPLDAIAQAAVDWVLDANRPDAGAHYELPVELVIRGSTAPVRQTA